MINRIKNVFKQWQAERQRTRELHIKLEGLTDHTFLDRALHGEWKLNNGIHENCRCVI